MGGGHRSGITCRDGRRRQAIRRCLEWEEVNARRKTQPSCLPLGRAHPNLLAHTYHRFYEACRALNSEGTGCTTRLILT